MSISGRGKYQGQVRRPLISNDVVTDVVAESLRAFSIHGWDNVPRNPNCENGDFSNLKVLGEEFGEVCEALTYDKGNRDNLYKELIQVANVAMQWAGAVREVNEQTEYAQHVGDPVQTGEMPRPDDTTIPEMGDPLVDPPSQLNSGWQWDTDLHQWTYYGKAVADSTVKAIGHLVPDERYPRSAAPEERPPSQETEDYGLRKDWAADRAKAEGIRKGIPDPRREYNPWHE